MSHNAPALCECGCGQPTIIGKNGRPNRFLRGHARRPRTLPDGRRVCQKCGTPKPLEEFSQRSSKKYESLGGRTGVCKSCTNKAAKDHYANNKDRYRERNLMVLYGITIKDYDAILARQGGGCAICKSTDRLHVDHCHSTGKVRGILCSPCNTAIGGFRDDPELLRRAISYLE